MTKLLPDLIAMIGLGLLATGLWQFNPALSLCIVGVLLMVFGLLLARRQAAALQTAEVNRAG